MCILLIFADDLSIIIYLVNAALIYSRSGDEARIQILNRSLDGVDEWDVFVDSIWTECKIYMCASSASWATQKSESSHY